MRDSTRKKLEEWGILAPPDQTRKDLFSLGNIGGFFTMMGIASLFFGGIQSGLASSLMAIAIIVFGLVLTIIGVLRQGNDKNNKE